MINYKNVRVSVAIFFGASHAMSKRIYLFEDLRVYQVSKWSWYFNYLLAKEILKQPKHYCRIVYHRKIVEPTTAQIGDEHKREITKLKGQLTKAKNKLAAFERNCKANDPLNIDPYTEWPSYKMAVCQLQQMTETLAQKCKEYNIDSIKK